mmetsp:Transcript_104114/g.271872  ORF Transcript_104114/g.271872 Transcript_104114/m.271872 type:complete len:459 (-) Transcript_104114:822-2198(-)
MDRSSPEANRGDMFRGAASIHRGSTECVAPMWRWLAWPKNRFEVLSWSRSVTQWSLLDLFGCAWEGVFVMDRRRLRSAHPRATCMVMTVFVSSTCFSILCRVLISSPMLVRLHSMALLSCSGSATTARAAPTRPPSSRLSLSRGSADTARRLPSAAMRLIVGSTRQRSAMRSSALWSTMQTPTGSSLFSVSIRSVTRPRPPSLPTWVWGSPQSTTWCSQAGVRHRRRPSILSRSLSSAAMPSQGKSGWAGSAWLEIPRLRAVEASAAPSTPGSSSSEKVRVITSSQPRGTTSRSVSSVSTCEGERATPGLSSSDSPSSCSTRSTLPSMCPLGRFGSPSASNVGHLAGAPQRPSCSSVQPRCRSVALAAPPAHSSSCRTRWSSAWLREMQKSRSPLASWNPTGPGNRWMPRKGRAAAEGADGYRARSTAMSVQRWRMNSWAASVRVLPRNVPPVASLTE